MEEKEGEVPLPALTGMALHETSCCYFKRRQQTLNLRPLPQGQGSFLPVVGRGAGTGRCKIGLFSPNLALMSPQNDPVGLGCGRGECSPGHMNPQSQGSELGASSALIVAPPTRAQLVPASAC